jgi:hypothetical protein
VILLLGKPPNPKFDSINDLIDPEACSVRYSSFDNVVEMIAELSKGALLGKLILKVFLD